MSSPYVTDHGVTYLRPTHEEKVEQAQILTLAASLGGRVWKLAMTRRQRCHKCGAATLDQGTHQTPGLADVLLFMPPPPLLPRVTDWTLVWVEAKGAGGSLRPEQLQFRAYCLKAGIAYVVGGLDAFMLWLVDGGWLHAKNLPHYRAGTVIRAQKERDDGPQRHEVQGASPERGPRQETPARADGAAPVEGPPGEGRDTAGGRAARPRPLHRRPVRPVDK